MNPISRREIGFMICLGCGAAPLSACRSRIDETSLMLPRRGHGCGASPSHQAKHLDGQDHSYLKFPGGELDVGPVCPGAQFRSATMRKSARRALSRIVALG